MSKTATPHLPFLADPSSAPRLPKTESSQIYDSSRQRPRQSDSVRLGALPKEGARRSGPPATTRKRFHFRRGHGLCGAICRDPSRLGSFHHYVSPFKVAL